MESHKDNQPHFPVVIYQVLSACIRLMVKFQQNLTMVTAIENNDPSKLCIRIVERANNIYKRFANELELKIDGGALWSEVKNHASSQKPTQVFHQQLLDSTSNDSNRSPLVASESRETKCKSHPHQLFHLSSISHLNTPLSPRQVLASRKRMKKRRQPKWPPYPPWVSAAKKLMVTFDTLNGVPFHSKD